MPEFNPFAGLMPSDPESLMAQRSADFEAQTKGQDFWVQEAGRTGQNIRRSMLARGIALGPEDQRAINTKAIMAGAQQRLASLVQSGDLDAMDAQELVLGETMSAFMKQGDYQAAQSLLPALNQIRTYKLEQNKLTSEIQENTADTFRAGAAGNKDLAAIDQAERELPSKIEERAANARMRDATARLRDRTDPNLRSSGAGGPGAASADPMYILPSQRAKLDERIGANLSLYNVLNDLSDIVTQVPAVASDPAGLHNSLYQRFEGIKNYLENSGSLRGFDSLSSNAYDGSAGQSPRAIALANQKDVYKMADNLGVHRSMFESMVISAAYTLARANDSGGRLSDNDYKNAMTMLGAVQDPKAARATFSNLARQKHNELDAAMRGVGKDRANHWFGPQLEDEAATYDAFAAKHGSLRSDQPADAAGSVRASRPADIDAILRKNGVN